MLPCADAEVFGPKTTQWSCFRTSHPTRSLILPRAIAGAIALSACGASTVAPSTSTPSSATAASSTPVQPTATTVARVALPTASTAASPVPSVQAGKNVDANKASIAELQAAFEAASIRNAARWAREVDKHRRYPTDDPTFTELRQGLAKYNPDAETVEKIIATQSL